jgi:hypothetical protein
VQCPGLRTQIVGASVHMDNYDTQKWVEGIVMGIVGLSKNFDLWNLGAHYELRRPPHNQPSWYDRARYSTIRRWSAILGAYTVGQTDYTTRKSLMERRFGSPTYVRLIVLGTHSQGL